MVAFTVTVAVVGIEVTEGGFTLQLPLPETREQVRLIAPVNPLGAVTLIGPLVVLLPAFTVGNDPVSLSANTPRICSAAGAKWVVGFEPDPTPCTLKSSRRRPRRR